MVAERLNTRRGGSGEPLVLIHGIGSALTVWNRMLPALEARHEVIGVDLPGFGESPMPDAGCSPAALAEAVAGELDAQGIERPLIVGNSLGGWVALELAARGRAAGVLAISPAGLWSEREKWWVDSSLKSTRRATKAVAPIASTVMRSRAGRASLIQFASRPWRCPPEVLATAVTTSAGARNFEATLEQMLANQPTDLGSIACPVLIAWGTRDYLLFPRQGRRFERLISGAELRPLEGLGHAPMFDAPDECVELVLEFTRQASTGTRQASTGTTRHGKAAAGGAAEAPAKS